ncbi:MAG: hypothetical protein NUW07_06840, partial [Candidatus Saccharicenans sp.]|nr:hypothetical protein [Candidatus Saccharicenans sp.]
MKRMKMTRTATLIGFMLALLAGLWLSGCREKTEKKADLVLLGKIFTGSQARPWVEALAAADGKILAAGSNKQIKKYIGPETRAIELKGGVAIPGLIDAHTHFSSGGRSLI